MALVYSIIIIHRCCSYFVVVFNKIKIIKLFDSYKVVMKANITV